MKRWSISFSRMKCSKIVPSQGRLITKLLDRCDVELGTLKDDENQKTGTPDELLKAFQGWDPRYPRDFLLPFFCHTRHTHADPHRIGTIVSHVDSVLEWRLYTHDSVEQWVHSSGRFCLIGDSAHAMTPYLAQGAAMGIEDAAILGGILEVFPDTQDLTKSLALYEKLRVGRTSMVARASVDSRWFTQMEDGPEQEKRDEYLLSHPGIWEDHINIRSRKQFLDELFGYDAYATLDAELKAISAPGREGS